MSNVNGKGWEKTGGQLLVLMLALTVGHLTRAADPVLDITYAETADGPLLLDLYLPDVANPPLILWIHGGAWRFGNKDNPPPLPVVEQGFALASIEFRPATTAPSPGQVHDIKAAIRYLRANAGRHGFDADRIAIWGHSSGGHLAALVGVTNGVTFYEGDLGEHADTSSAVQAIIDVSGPTNLTTILAQSTAFGAGVRVPALEVLLSGGMEEEGVMERARQASPFFQVDAGDPPLLLMHGLQDNQVPVNQALELEGAYRQRGLYVESYWLQDATHGSPDYFRGANLDNVVSFLREHM